MIKITSFEKKYYDFTFQLTNLTIETGEVIGVFGACGSGKSTLLKCIAGINSYNGSINFEPVGKVNLITEEGSFFSSATVLENGDLFKALFKGFDLEKYLRLVERFNLPKKKKAYKLSRGQQAMLEMCIGVSKKSDYLLLDEPFLGADIFTRQTFLQLLIEKKQMTKL